MVNSSIFTERLLGSGGAALDTVALLQRNVWEIPGAVDTTPVACRSHVSGSWFVEKGGKWILGNYGNTLYNHRRPPNAREQDCINMFQQKGQLTARSLHFGGVNLLLCDGSVSFMSETVTIEVWQGLASRAGAEVPF